MPSWRGGWAEEEGSSDDEEKKDCSSDRRGASSHGASHRSKIGVSNLSCPSQVLVIKSVIESDVGGGATSAALDPALPDKVAGRAAVSPSCSSHGPRGGGGGCGGGGGGGGVKKVMVSLDSRTVTIDHDPLLVPISTIVSRLRSMEFDASLLRDGADDLVPTPSNPSPHALCRTQLYVTGICCNSEVPAVTSILRRHPLGGVSRVSVNVPARYVYVDHDPFVVTAKELADELNGEGFGAKVRRDGGRGVPGPRARGGGTGGASAAGADAADAGGSGAPPPPPAAEGVRSAFALDVPSRPLGPLRDSDIPKIQSCLSAVGGIFRIGVNVGHGMIFADHDSALVDAHGIRSALGRAGYPTTIVRDGGAEREKGSGGASSQLPGIGSVASSKFVESTILLPYLDDLDRVRRLERYFSRRYSKSQIRAAYPHVPSRTVKVEHDPRLVSAPSICDALRMEGAGPRGKGGGNWYDRAEVACDGAVEGLALPLVEDYDCGEEDEGDGDDEMRTCLGGLHVNVILSGIFWVVSVLSFVDGWDDLKYAGLLSVLFGIPPVAAKAYRTLRRCQFDANCMMVVAAFGALALREYDEAASVAFLFAVSEWLEARATARARRALGAIVSLRPDHANVMDPRSGRVVVVPASSVPVGSRVSVRTGDKIPADGTVVEGTSAVDESSLTGEARPVDKGVGSTVSGGSINIGLSRLIVQTTSTVDDSAVSRLIRLVEEAQANRSPTEKIVDAFARTYTPVVVIMAGLMCTIPWFWGREVGRYWTLNGLIIIVIACPCALTISTPVTYAAGLAATAQRGVIVKGGARLESLGNVKKVVFDKTGTLTEGRFRLVHLETVGEDVSRKRLLELLALIEAPSSHPMSATLVDAAKREGVPVPPDSSLTDHTVLKGEGVRATVDGRTVHVGNARLFERLGMYGDLDDDVRGRAEGWGDSGGTVGFLGVEGRGIIGAFCVSDAVREEAREVVTALREEDGIEVVMLTGDGTGAARAVGREVGLGDGDVHAGLLPEDKLHFVGSLKGRSGGRDGRRAVCGSRELVLMCGDGVNDAPALAVADVGVAMGEGAALAMEMSDVTLMDSNLTKLRYSIRMGGRVIRTIRENIAFSLFAKLLVVGLTFAGRMTLLLAIASDVGVMLIVTLNGMKLLPGRGGGGFKLAVANKRAGGGGRSRVLYDELPLEGRSGRLPDVV